MSDNSQPKKNALDSSAAALYGLRNQKTNKTASIKLNHFKGRISIAYSPDDDGKFFAIPVDLHAAIELMVTIEAVSRSKGPRRETFQAKGWSKETKQRDILGTVVVEKDDRGIVSMGVSNTNSNPKMLAFRTSLNFERVDHEGRPISPAESSAIAAIAWAEMTKKMILQIYTAEYEHPEPFQKSSGGKGSYGNKGGGNNYNRGGNSNYNRSNNSGGGYQDSYDDEDLI